LRSDLEHAKCRFLDSLRSLGMTIAVLRGLLAKSAAQVLGVRFQFSTTYEEPEANILRDR